MGEDWKGVESPKPTAANFIRTLTIIGAAMSAAMAADGSAWGAA
jgi:hypothetical protein